MCTFNKPTDRYSPFRVFSSRIFFDFFGLFFEEELYQPMKGMLLSTLLTVFCIPAKGLGSPKRPDEAEASSSSSSSDPAFSSAP